ncbi:Indole-3-acetic acid-induced protein ARG2 [Morella rubra]|uniref:Indole-3-acetic acid-induced protein ARG2 n=1 Tax=Morella rubra TaxID=262757 RepID=A0A6A1WCJ3_9ROSI|nr:Indole-3-acetic acid-induced protein ARG2 [Morella rubra]
MAPSFSNAELLSALVHVVVDGLSNVSTRRGYAASTQGTTARLVRGGGNSAARMLKKQELDVVGANAKVAWVPDPVTGYYKPENRGEEIDVADLRAILLNNKH